MSVSREMTLGPDPDIPLVCHHLLERLLDGGFDIPISLSPSPRQRLLDGGFDIPTSLSPSPRERLLDGGFDIPTSLSPSPRERLLYLL